MPGRATAAATACAAAVMLVCACADTEATTAPTQAADQRVVPSTAPADVAAGFEPLRSRPAPAPPTRVRIPAIGVDAEIEHLGRLPDGTVDVPKEWGDVGWYAEGPRPGEPGPAVLLGHVDSQAGPAVFSQLRNLEPGAVVDVVAEDGTLARFVVERVQRYPKDRFPTEEVYLPTLRSELRLVTCGGAFDRATGHYVDNVIAFATPAP